MGFTDVPVNGTRTRWIAVSVNAIARKAVGAEAALDETLRMTNKKMAVNTTSRRKPSHTSTPPPSVVAVLAQRLVRVVCTKCKEPHVPSDAELEQAGITPEMAVDATFVRGAGCNACNNGGYRGRIGIYELMMLSAKIREMVFQNASAVELRRVAEKEGMSTLYRDGLEKVMRGVTTLEEVYRVAKKTESDPAAA